MALLALEVVRLSMTGRDHSSSIRSVTSTAVCRLSLIYALVVTGSTFRHTMRSSQWETRKVMIEPGLLPEILRVAILARHQLAVMRVVLMMTLTALLT